MTPDEAKIHEQEKKMRVARTEFQMHWAKILERLPGKHTPDAEQAAWLMFIMLRYPEIKT